MTDRLGIRPDAEQGAHLLRVDIDRPKRIDGYIDYFGNGGARPTGFTAKRADDRTTDELPRGPAPWGEGDS